MRLSWPADRHTPHGDEDRFAISCGLSTQTSAPKRIAWGNTPRRLKEDLKDLRGRRLSPDRYASTVKCALSSEDYDLYKAVTAYISQFIPRQTGRRRS